jgi:hypothetical protein
VTWSSPHGRGVPARDFEEARARADEVRQRAAMRHGLEAGPTQRRGLGLLASAFVIGVMVSPIWYAFGPMVGLASAVLFVVGASALWRLWR